MKLHLGSLNADFSGHVVSLVEVLYMTCVPMMPTSRDVISNYSSPFIDLWHLENISSVERAL